LYAIAGRQHVTHSDNNHYRILENCQPIEFRHPFFDTELIEYLLTLPNHYKYREGVIKILLREALKDIYPPAIYERKDKAEFSEALLAQMSVLDMKKIWSNSQLIKNRLIDESLVEALLNQYQNSSIGAEGVGRFWRATALELWVMEI
jgi:asparagine synthase (glutamine-hydrolysing)